MSCARILAFTVIAFGCVVQANASDVGELQAKLDQTLDTHTTAQRTTVALKVVDLKSGKVLYDRFGDRLFTPASNLKIYTSACALDMFGPNQNFPTSITARVSVRDRSIVGDLTIVGGGNAMLSTADLELLADRVVDEWGVRSLRGKVVVDNSRYSDAQLGPGWMWDDQQYYFNMRVTPLMLDFNVRKLPGRFDADGDPVRRAIVDPSAWISDRFTELLRVRGVKVADLAADESAEHRTISYNGTSLAATLKHFNHVSENAVGEVLLHEIAVAKGVVRPTWSDGASHITNWLQKTAGLAESSFKLVDGSGLSRYNLISADSSVTLLAFMRKHKHFQTFFNSLPVYPVATGPGVTKMLVRAKPGGMSGVSTISGYLQTSNGRQLAFSLLANGFIGSSKPVRDLRGQVWKQMVQYEADAN